MKPKVIGLLIVVAVIFFFLGRSCGRLEVAMEVIGNPLYEIEPIYSKALADTLYLKRKIWGITGNHQAVVLSINSKRDFQIDTQREYVLRGDGELLYQLKKDSLFLYTSFDIQEPRRFPSNINVVHRKLDNADYKAMKKKLANTLKVF